MTFQIQLTSGDATAAPCDVLVVSVLQEALDKNSTLSGLERALGGGLFAHAKASEFEGKNEQQLDLPTFGKIPARRLLLIGAGPKGDLDAARLRALAAVGMRSALGTNVKAITFVPPLPEPDLRALGEGLVLGAYRFTKYFTGERKPKSELGKISVLVPAAGAKSAASKKSLELGVQVARAVSLARDAVNEPPNVLYPETLAGIARSLAKKHGLKLKVLGKKQIFEAGMLLHYAVGQGSANEPRFIHLTYRPKKPKKKLAFVGKGLTFDSGGLCIKPAPGMGEMKSDMAGAAAVLGLMAAVAVVRPDVEVHGIIGAAENMPDGSAYRPADVFSSLDGKTVEIINTDAEGRLVLADALTYATKLAPDVIVDAATLTGAVLVALGKTYSAFYASDDALARTLETAAREAGESFWRMPLIEELGDQLKSDIADLKHTGDRWGGSITAALFLREFVAKVPWIHCDIAGPALSERARGVVPKGGTGHGVLTFLRFVENAGS